MEVCPVLHSSACPEHISPSASLTDPLPKESQEHTHTIQTFPIASTSKRFTPHEWALMQLNQITPPPYSCKSKHRTPCCNTEYISWTHKQGEHSQHMLLVDVWFSEMFEEVNCCDRQWLYDDTFNTQEQVTYTHTWVGHSAHAQDGVKRRPTGWREDTLTDRRTHTGLLSLWLPQTGGRGSEACKMWPLKNTHKCKHTHNYKV